jgi:hypothetical protein
MYWYDSGGRECNACRCDTGSSLFHISPDAKLEHSGLGAGSPQCTKFLQWTDCALGAYIERQLLKTVPWKNFGNKKVFNGYTGPLTSRFAPEGYADAVALQDAKDLSVEL